MNTAGRTFCYYVVMLPKVSILISTLNSKTVIGPCLKSINEQNYPKDQIEIVMGDGGSTDGTLEIAQQYGAKIAHNPLKTGESGKMAALRAASGEFVALIDSDNILPHPEWLKNMIAPLLEQPGAVGSEPWEYTWRAQDGFICRYSALIGMNDPVVIFTGNYDRLNKITNKWTEVPHSEEDKGKYLLCKFTKAGIPTIGANGTIFRRDFLVANSKGDYLFDIDVLASYVCKTGSVAFIKVKDGVVHTFCESDISKFARKQRRRVKDYLFHKSKGAREFGWENATNYMGLGKFIIYTVLVFPLLIQTVIGYSRKPDPAWLFHPLACWITLWEYGRGTVLGIFNKEEASRVGWKQ
jgi:glycosyltransferase involved in cell wall biosynthesis